MTFFALALLCFHYTICLPRLSFWRSHSMIPFWQILSFIMGIRGIEPRLAAHKTTVLTVTLYALVQQAGFEPAKLTQRILSPPPLTTRVLLFLFTLHLLLLITPSLSCFTFIYFLAFQFSFYSIKKLS